MYVYKKKQCEMFFFICFVLLNYELKVYTDIRAASEIYDQ